MNGWERELRDALPTSGPLSFAIAQALDEVINPRRALRVAEDRIRDIQEFVGRPEDD